MLGCEDYPEHPEKQTQRGRRNITFCCRVSSLGLYLKGSSHFIKCHIISPLSRRRSSDWDEEICQWTTFFSSSSLLWVVVNNSRSLSAVSLVCCALVSSQHSTFIHFVLFFWVCFYAFLDRFVKTLYSVLAFLFALMLRTPGHVWALGTRARERRSERDWISKASQNSGSSQFLSLLSGVHMWNFFITQIIGFSYIDLKISLRKLIVCLSLTHQNSLGRAYGREDGTECSRREIYERNQFSFDGEGSNWEIEIIHSISHIIDTFFFSTFFRSSLNWISLNSHIHSSPTMLRRKSYIHDKMISTPDHSFKSFMWRDCAFETEHGEFHIGVKRVCECCANFLSGYIEARRSVFGSKNKVYTRKKKEAKRVK